MPRNCNLIGRNVSRQRWQRGWSQEELVVKMQLLGCYMTRDILASIETLRCIATDKQIAVFAAVFGVPIQELFPTAPHSLCRESELREPKRRRRRNAKPRLARHRRK